VNPACLRSPPPLANASLMQTAEGYAIFQSANKHSSGLKINIILYGAKLNQPVSADGVPPPLKPFVAAVFLPPRVKAHRKIFIANQARFEAAKVHYLVPTATKSFRNFSWESSHP